MSRVLALVTDAYGGRGGIARYNRDFISALSLCDRVEDITVCPRLAPEPYGTLPEKVEQQRPIPSPLTYSASTLKHVAVNPKPDVIFCGHLFMAPLAAGLAAFLRVPYWLQVHGIDAWDKPQASVVWAAERASLVTSVSRYTKSRMSEWWNGDPSRLRVLPNTVGPQFTPGQKPSDLLDRYGLRGKRVILTVARISQYDRYKGHERVISCLEAVCRAVPDAVYIIVGDGDDTLRLQRVAEGAGVLNRIVFAGHVPEDELLDHYRVADVFIMPSTKEGFGIVFLEAALSGLAVIGGNRDGSVDALADGKIGRLVDPSSAHDIAEALISALEKKEPERLAAAQRFAFDAFKEHVDHLTRSLVK